MALQTNALPPSLVAEINELKRRLSGLERKPKLGSVNERLPYSSYQSPSLEGTQGSTVHTLGFINSTGLNQPVVIMQLPFHIPMVGGVSLDVSITIWMRDLVTQAKTAEITLTKANDSSSSPSSTQLVTWSWLHPQPIGFDDLSVWKGFAFEYRVNKRVTSGDTSYTVGVGAPILVTGVPAGTYTEESTTGNPRVNGNLSPVGGA